jgi:hypothetical protein
MDPLVPALILSKVLELGVTEYGINSGRMVEANPIIRDRTTRISVNSAFMLASPILYKEIKKKNKKLALATGIVLVVGNSYLVYRNLRIVKP